MAYNINTTAETETTNISILQAQEVLATTLKNTRSVARSSGIDIKNAIFNISEAADLLEEVQPSKVREMASISIVNSAMNHLREGLAELQQNTQHSEILEETMKTIAKTLAILYPISKFGESKMPANPAQPRESVPQHIKDRRRAPRMAIEAEVGFQSDTNFFMGFSEDVSTGGLFISTYDIRPIGAILNLNFTLPDGHLISVDGVVRWVREYNETTPDTSPGMGIQFDGLSPEDKEAIEMFIEQRPALFYDDE